jgi:hypothetical protein
MRMVTALTAEVAVLRERLEIMERIAAARGLLSPEDIDAFAPDGAVDEIFKAKRLSLMKRVFGAWD